MGVDVQAGRPEESNRHLTPEQRVVRVVPDIAGIEGEFDYLVPERLSANVRIGTIVRVTLHGRRTRAWVVEDDVTPPPGVRLLELQKVTGWGPPQELIDLAGWAAHRWVGKRVFHLQTASPLRAVRELTLPAHGGDPRSTDLSRPKLIRLPPAESPLDVVLSLDSSAPTLLVVPSQRSAVGWIRRLRAEGRAVAAYPEQWAQAASGGVTVVGTRAAIWAPLPDLDSIVVLDAHDRALHSESSPTWNAFDVARERAHRRGIPLIAVSATPRLTQLQGAEVETVSRERERAGWAAVHVVDMRVADPRAGMYTEVLVRALRSERRVLCILNRKGRALLIACIHCAEVAQCQVCGSAQELRDMDLRCRRCSAVQPVVCRHCGGGKFKQLRVGVTRVREELEALARRPVAEVTSDSTEPVTTDVIVGTEAALYRVSTAEVVAFLDFDQELLASRVYAGEDALVLLGRAARIVGGRKRDGVVIVQTRHPEHEVVVAAVHGDPQRFIDVEIPRREAMGWPPFRALARVSGKHAEGFAGRIEGADVMGPVDGRWLISAADHDRLSNVLWAAQPNKGVRIEVDPPGV